MYEEFFHLKNRPFAPVGPVESFVGIGPLGDALRQLQRSLAQGQSISLLIGENGSGKSHLCKYLATVETARHRPVYLSTAGFHTRRALLQAMLYELGADYVGLTEQEARLKLLESARKLQAGGRKLLLILDESHLLSSKMYEELRTLIDHTPTGQQQIQLVLAGSMELEEQLFAPELQAFNQRIGAQIVLESLTLQQSAEYLEARLHWAGAQTSSQAFSEEALEMICRACDGNIRCLNQLADHSLLLAYVEEVSPATPEHVKAALKDLKALPLQFSSTGIAEVESSGPDLSSTAELEALEELDSEPVSSPAPASPTVPVDELELLELFGQPESLATAKVAEVDETDSEADSPEETPCPATSPEFSVLEVGAGIEDAAAEQPLVDEEETAMDVVQTPPLFPAQSPDVVAANGQDDGEMQEFGVTDHYARLDDQFSRADGNLAQLAWSTLPELPVVILGIPAADDVASSATTSEPLEYVTGDACGDQESTTEEQLLASIRELHDDLDGMIEHRPLPKQPGEEADANFDWLEYDVIQPGCMQDPAWIPEEGIEPADADVQGEQSTFKPATTGPEPCEPPIAIEQTDSEEVPLVESESTDVRNVYELLFDRLRQRRRQQLPRS